MRLTAADSFFKRKRKCIYAEKKETHIVTYILGCDENQVVFLFAYSFPGF
jgi:hypothetical protein